ncbi:MAG: LptA/OstA family protein [Sphaerochaetaceae bacterium]|nr:LptA/OstA family protein [Sphaerochaetaceae bacterium]
MKKTLVIILLFFTLIEASFLFAEEEKIPVIDFSGGYTKVKRVGNVDTVTLSDSAQVNTKDISVTADEIEISGENYRYLKCSGNVIAEEKQNNIILKTPELFYDRDKNTILINSWIEIDDSENEIKMSGAYLEFNLEQQLFNLQIDAEINKATEKGQLIGKAASIIYNNKEKSLILQGNASVTWGEDNYEASLIRINLETEEIILEGKITGTVNG